jgi:hypothetical protein
VDRLSGTEEVLIMPPISHVMLASTRRDPQNHYTRIALAHLLGAQDARDCYDRLLTKAIMSYGDRHQPSQQRAGFEISTPGSGCDRCDANGHDYDRLNHQTGAMISGIYADHFPEPVKDQLRFYASLISWQTDQAVQAWRRAGRKYSTFRPWMEQSRELASGRQSYY